MVRQSKILPTLLLALLTPFAALSQVEPPPMVEPAGPALFVVTVDGKKGFIDGEGAVAIDPVYDNAYPFSDGLAAIQVNGGWGFIDTKGRIAIEPQFVMVGFFSEGVARFRDRRYSGPWGYIDKAGKVVIEPQFDDAGQFRNGIARVGYETLKSKLLTKIADVGSQYSYRFVDRDGDFVEEPAPAHYATGEPGELIQFSRNGMVGFMDSGGEVIIKPQFQAGSAFSDGLACVRKEGLFGFVDRTGQWVIPPRFEYPNDFSEGLVGVPLGAGAWGFIDRTGQVVIAPKFGWVYGGFRHGLAEVLVDGRLGYINKLGEWVWEPSD